MHLGVSLSSAARPAAFASTDTKGPDDVFIPAVLTRSVAIAVSLPIEPKSVHTECVNACCMTAGDKFAFGITEGKCIVENKFDFNVPVACSEWIFFFLCY